VKQRNQSHSHGVIQTVNLSDARTHVISVNV